MFWWCVTSKINQEVSWGVLKCLRHNKKCRHSLTVAYLDVEVDAAGLIFLTKTQNILCFYIKHAILMTWSVDSISTWDLIPFTAFTSILFHVQDPPIKYQTKFLKHFKNLQNCVWGRRWAVRTDYQNLLVLLPPSWGKSLLLVGHIYS